MANVWISKQPGLDDLDHLLAPRRSVGTRPLRLALSYAAIALAWISATSLLVAPAPANFLEVLKGAAFVGVTAVALYVLLRRHDAAERAAAIRSRSAS